jgi:hypothetical protein
MRRVQPVAYYHYAAFCFVHGRKHVAAKPPIALVAVLLRAHPVEVLHVVGNDERRPVLPMLHATYLLAS